MHEKIGPIAEGIRKILLKDKTGRWGRAPVFDPHREFNTGDQPDTVRIVLG